MTVNLPEIQKENKRRLAVLYAPYDPVSGVGSPIKRFRLRINSKTEMFLPEAMRESPLIENLLKFKSLSVACTTAFGDTYHKQITEVLEHINKERIPHINLNKR